MKKIFLFVFIFLAACSGQVPQVTVTSKVTVTLPPTATIIPTPTLHPQFIALQDQIAASGERFYLTPDGAINDGATPVKGIKVDAEGKITITVNGEPVKIDPSIMNFDDEKGLSIEGFENTDGDGDWEKPPVFTIDQLRSMTPEQKLAAAPDEQGYTKTINGVYVIYTGEDGAKKDTAYNLTTGEWEVALENTEAGAAIIEILNKMKVDLNTIELKMDGDTLMCIDNATQAEVCRDGKFELHFAQEALADSGDLVPTKYKPNPNGSFKNTPPNEMNMNYGVPLLREFRSLFKNTFGVDPIPRETLIFNMLLLDPITLNKWGVVVRADRNDPNTKTYLVYETNVDGVKQVAWTPVLPVPKEEVLAYWND